MTMKGKLTRSNLAQTMPVHADPLSFTNASFRRVNQVTFGYRTNTDAAAVVLPTDLEIEENPEVSVMFLSYGFSSVGGFREYIHIIQARFRGEEVGFVPHIFISNERGMLAGREREGYPKLLGEIDFDMDQPNVYGLITTRLSRPAGITLAQGIFRPRECVGEISADKPQVVKALGLRVIGSARPRTCGRESSRGSLTWPCRALTASGIRRASCCFPAAPWPFANSCRRSWSSSPGKSGPATAR